MSNGMVVRAAWLLASFRLVCQVDCFRVRRHLGRVSSIGIGKLPRSGLPDRIVSESHVILEQAVSLERD